MNSKEQLLIKVLEMILNNESKDEAKLETAKNSLNCFIGEYVIIRTCSAGVWAGVLNKKAGKEVLLINAKRLWKWKALKSISLSAVARYGIDANNSKVAPEVDNIWLEAIEIIQVTESARISIVNAKEADQS